jgi:hypothetical protein
MERPHYIHQTPLLSPDPEQLGCYLSIPIESHGTKSEAIALVEKSAIILGEKNRRSRKLWSRILPYSFGFNLVWVIFAGVCRPIPEGEM